MPNRVGRVVITGASSGIGLDLARRFLAEGSVAPAIKLAFWVGVADLLVEVLGKEPATTFVVIDEVEIEIGASVVSR